MTYVRKMIDRDVPAARRLTLENFPGLSAEQAASLPLELSDMFSNAAYRPTFFVAKDGSELVGLAGWNWAWLNYGVYELCWGQVRASHRGRGLGRLLVEARLDDISATETDSARAPYVIVSTHLDAMYARYGFRTIAEMTTWQHPRTCLMITELARREDDTTLRERLTVLAPREDHPAIGVASPRQLDALATAYGTGRRGAAETTQGRRA